MFETRSLEGCLKKRYDQGNQLWFLARFMKTAVVLFNLGGPTSMEGVRPFLFNLFKDPHILRMPFFARYPLAWFISTLRTKKAKGIYAQIGGGSPLNHNTLQQCHALQWLLKNRGHDVKVFMCMRYAPPMTPEVVRNVKEYDPDRVILLPLYPQFSTSTTKSSFQEWDDEIKIQAPFLDQKTERQCCYPTGDLFLQSHIALLKEHLEQCPKDIPLSLLFSAHGIPLDMIAGGDPYAFQVEQTVNAIMNDPFLKNYSFMICYQSRVGPKKWLGPSLDIALNECKEKGQGAVVVPISFVSDHSETLVELDIQYKDIAAAMHLLHYSRVKALGDDTLYIDYLAQQVESLLKGQTCPRLCPKEYTDCYQKTAARYKECKIINSVP